MLTMQWRCLHRYVYRDESALYSWFKRFSERSLKVPLWSRGFLMVSCSLCLSALSGRQMFYCAKLGLGWYVHIKTFLLSMAKFLCDIPCTAVLRHFHKLCLEILIRSDFHFCFWIRNESMRASSPFSIKSEPFTILDISLCLLLIRMTTKH